MAQIIDADFPVGRTDLTSVLWTHVLFTGNTGPQIEIGWGANNLYPVFHKILMNNASFKN